MSECRRIIDLMGAYVYGDLTPEETRMVDSHVTECRSCWEELEARARAVQLVPNDIPALTDDERLRVMWSVKGALRSEHGEKRLPTFKRVPVLGFAAAVVIIAAFATGAIFGLRSKPPKVIVKRVPVTKERQVTPAPPATPVEAPDRVADTSGPSINQPIIRPGNEIAVQPPSRDNMPDIYRWKPERRSPVEPPKLSTVIPPMDQPQSVLEQPREEDPTSPIPPMISSPDAGAHEFPGSVPDVEPGTATPDSD